MLTVNILLALFLILAYLSANVDPATYWIFAFIALSYPIFLLLNILFIIWWLLLRKWYFLISLCSILLGWQALRSTFQVNFKSAEATGKTLKVATYNVRLFNYYQWNKDTSAWQRIINYIHAESPDIVCFQEFITLPGTDHDLDNLKRKMAPLAYTHVYYTDRVRGKLNFGMATFSRYPIIHKKMIDFEESLNGSISSDIVVDRDTIRIYNCHLQSIRLRKDYNDLLDSLIFNYSEKQLDELKDISHRMKEAFIRRSEQVQILKNDISNSPYPVIICGDFNDTPVSYTYRNMSENLKDTFIESGTGIGTTFRGNFPYVRIDYVLYSPHFTSNYYRIKKVRWSDHYPLMARFIINEKVDSTNQHSPPTE